MPLPKYPLSRHVERLLTFTLFILLLHGLLDQESRWEVPKDKSLSGQRDTRYSLAGQKQRKESTKFGSAVAVSPVCFEGSSCTSDQLHALRHRMTDRAPVEQAQQGRSESSKSISAWLQYRLRHD